MAWKFWRGNQLIRRTDKARDRAIKITLEKIGSDTDQDIPLDEGTLLRSKFIKVADGKGVISYGGGPGTGHPKVPYAVKWHEKEADFQHGRKSRYLADNVNKTAGREYSRILASELRKAW